ncbi:sensor histidine kinase [Kordiimonas gwangyangensis]|uniref:sensor histidine kinase n=1 Tax=Kordiimonas gwangyangensis TaxID=288022 RepID=UPI000375AD7F|nr:GAF domain-containing sensor histidine kinase [Kordiimonas gwangyangensis]
MLSGDVADGRLVAVSVAYLVYGPDNRLKFYNEGAAKVFPVFRERDVIGLTRDDVRDILRSQDDFRDTIDELTRRSAGGKRLTSDMGGFRFGKDGVFALDDLPLPDGTTVTVIRDLSGKKRAMDAVERLDAALTRLGQEEAIYNGTKARAYEILTEVACGALGASRTDVWLLNVDGTALYAQESYWDAGGEHRDMGRVDEAGCAPLFCAIKGLEPLTLLEPADAPELKGFDLAGYFRSVLLVPICRGPRAIGVILVAQADEARDWNASEISFVSYLCGLVMRMLEAHDRQVAEEGLRGFNEMLEKRVKDRTRELEEAMENLHLAQGELVRSEKMASLGGLVAGVAHEINTPLGVALTGITHMAEELTAFRRAVESGQIKRSDLNAFIEAVAEGTAMAERNLDRAAHLVRSFKMVAVDQTADDVRELDLAAYLGEIVESLRPTLRKTGVMVEASAEGDLHMQTVAGDISHVLTNLIMNAALHAFPEGWTREKVIKVQARRMPDRVTIEVIDNGAGIPEAIKDKIFEPFFTTARNKGGSGLGLNIVFNTVYQKLKGGIALSDAAGGGSHFTIQIPLQ